MCLFEVPLFSLVTSLFVSFAINVEFTEFLTYSELKAFVGCMICQYVCMCVHGLYFHLCLNEVHKSKFYFQMRGLFPQEYVATK